MAKTSPPDAAATDLRFAFGENWRAFLEDLNDERIKIAEESLRDALGDISGLSFLDVGSGSGLFSLAARRLGAEVVSFDYDRASVGCTEELHHRYRAGDRGWRIMQGSALDAEFMAELGTFDVVYSWGVLHHTGGMWDALELTCQRAAPGGRLFISLYNDEGRSSRYWRVVKRLYNVLPPRLRPLLVGLVLVRWIPSIALADLANHRHPLARYRAGAKERGMSIWNDWIDWVGGYPFEVAKPGDVFTFLRAHGFDMTRMRTDTGAGCNEYVAVMAEGGARG